MMQEMKMSLEDVPSLEECRLVVEDYWRRFLPLSLRGDMHKIQTAVAEFEAQVLRRAESMSSFEAGKTYIERISAERNHIADEYDADRDGLVRRLGLFEVLGTPVSAPIPTSSGVGELVVNTAVRATVWNVISKLFR
jgi:hypothetical protein